MKILINFFLTYSDHILALILAGILSYLVGIIYVKYGNAVSNRRVFARNFLLVAMSTTLIIIIVKESIALSLGLVGALSIVRFRVAIKEPEEIAYLFLIIATGIGLGAFQFAATIIAVPFIISLIIFRAHFGAKYRKTTHIGKYNIHIISKKVKQTSITLLTDMVERWADKVVLKHFSEDEDTASLLFFANFKDLASLDSFRKALVDYEDQIAVDIVENRELS